MPNLVRYATVPGRLFRNEQKIPAFALRQALRRRTMTNRQKDAATTHAKSSLKLISVSAVALLIGIGAAAAQGGSARQTEQEIEKQKDKELLTPIRPLPRKVGETSWPEAKPEAQQEANERKAAPMRETTGQSAQTNKPEQPNNTAANNQPNNAPQPAPNNQAVSNQPPPAQNTQPQPATAQNQNNATPQPQPAPTNQAAQQPHQNNAAQAPQPSQNAAQNAPANTAQNTPAANNAQPNQQPNQQNAQQPAQQQNTQQAQNNAQQDHASIRLGTDASGKVAINEDQEQQLAQALRRARPVEVNVGVQIGGPSPEGVRLAAVSADIVQVLPQFRGYSYFVTGEQVYIVDPKANRVVAMVPVKLTATVKREAPSRTTVGSAPAQATAQPEPNAAPAHTATVTTGAPEQRSRRSTRRDDDLAGIEAAIEREVQRKGLGGEPGQTVVIEEAPVVHRVPTRRWRPWFAGGDVQ